MIGMAGIIWYIAKFTSFFSKVFGQHNKPLLQLESWFDNALFFGNHAHVTVAIQTVPSVLYYTSTVNNTRIIVIP